MACGRGGLHGPTAMIPPDNLPERLSLCVGPAVPPCRSVCLSGRLAARRGSAFPHPTPTGPIHAHPLHENALNRGAAKLVVVNVRGMQTAKPAARLNTAGAPRGCAAARVEVRGRGAGRSDTAGTYSSVAYLRRARRAPAAPPRGSFHVGARYIACGVSHDEASGLRGGVGAYATPEPWVCDCGVRRRSDQGYLFLLALLAETPFR